jgi:hypothetical protein
MSTSVNAQMAAANPFMIVGGISGGAVPAVLTKEQIRGKHSQVENKIQARGLADSMINRRADRSTFLEGLLQDNKLEEANAYVDRIAGLLPADGGRKSRKRTYRRKHTRKNKKHGKKV